jgi:hypothetical protein
MLACGTTVAPTVRAEPGTTDAVSTVIMKDLVLVTVTLAFLGVAWLYTRSFDHL